MMRTSHQNNSRKRYDHETALLSRSVEDTSVSEIVTKYWAVVRRQKLD